MRRFFVESALWLLEAFHVDGLRIDAVHAIRDHSANPFMQEFTAAVQARAAERGRRVLVIAESSLNDTRLLRPAQQAGYGMDAQWSDDFHHALHAAATGERARYYVDFGQLEQVAQGYREGWIFAGQPSRYRGRRHGNSPRGFDSRRFVVFTQNHDQVGNRPLAERLGSPDDFALQRLLAVALLLSPFTPLLFMGQEYGEIAPFHYFVDHGDPTLIEAVRRGRRDEFEGFGADPAAIADAADPDTFAKSRLDHSLRGRARHRGLCALYRELLRVRREHPALRSGTDRLDAVVQDGMVVVRRWTGADELAFALAFGAGGSWSGREGWHVLLDTEDPRWSGAGGEHRHGGRPAQVAGPLQLAAMSAVVLVNREPIS